jgi:hypothetical protein
LCIVEAFVEEEFTKVGERGEEKWVESGVRRARWCWCFVGNVAEVEFNNVCCLMVVWIIIIIFRRRVEVTDDAVWGRETEVIREKRAPWNGRVE